MKNIMLAFDGSEYSNRALEYAKTFAERFEATLWFVHIFTHTSDLLGYEDYEKLYSKRKASGQTLLDGALQELSNTKLDVRKRLEEGPEAESILNIAKKCQADLIRNGNTWAWYIKGFVSWQCKPQSHSPLFMPSDGSALESKIPSVRIRMNKFPATTNNEIINSIIYFSFGFLNDETTICKRNNFM